MEKLIEAMEYKGDDGANGKISWRACESDGERGQVMGIVRFGGTFSRDRVCCVGVDRGRLRCHCKGGIQCTNGEVELVLQKEFAVPGNLNEFYPF